MSEPKALFTIDDLLAAKLLASPFPHVIFEEADSEVVVVDLVRGIYYYLTGTAAYLWMALHAGKSFSETVASLSDAIELIAEVSDDCERFTLDLMNEGLLKPCEKMAEAAPSAPDPKDFVTGKYVPPSIETYSDLQDILLLDPVHDVDESGWPIPRAT